MPQVLPGHQVLQVHQDLVVLPGAPGTPGTSGLLRYFGLSGTSGSGGQVGYGTGGILWSSGTGGSGLAPSSGLSSGTSGK